MKEATRVHWRHHLVHFYRISSYGDHVKLLLRQMVDCHLNLEHCIGWSDVDHYVNGLHFEKCLKISTSWPLKKTADVYSGNLYRVILTSKNQKTFCVEVLYYRSTEHRESKTNGVFERESITVVYEKKDRPNKKNIHGWMKFHHIDYFGTLYRVMWRRSLRHNGR
jgi:hypothetical protein